MVLKLPVTLLILLSSCATPAYKLIYQIMPEKKKICYFKKVSDIQKKKIKCYKLNAKDKDGKYKFADTLVIKKRAFREILLKQINGIFK